MKFLLLTQNSILHERALATYNYFSDKCLVEVENFSPISSKFFYFKWLMPFRKLLVLFILIFYIPRIFFKVSSNQIIYFSHPKPKSQFIYFLISIILGKKIVYDFYFSLYMRVANVENLNFFKMLNYWSLKLIEKTILIKSDVVIFPNKSEANSIEKLFNIDLTQKIVIIPLIKKAIINELQFRYFKNKDKKLNLVWIGIPNQIHNIKCVVDSVKKLSNYNLNPKLFIIIPNKNLVKNLTSSLHLESIDYEFVYGLTNLDESLNKFVYENCHVSFGHFGNDLQSKLTITNKYIESINMGIPCFSRESEALHEFGLYNKDFIITKLNSNELAEKINRFLKKDKQEINEILGNLRSIVHRDFNIDNSDKYFLKISNIFSII